MTREIGEEVRRRTARRGPHERAAEGVRGRGDRWRGNALVLKISKFGKIFQIFEGLVLGCIEADFLQCSVQQTLSELVFQNVAAKKKLLIRSTQCTSFCVSQNPSFPGCCRGRSPRLGDQSAFTRTAGRTATPPVPGVEPAVVLRIIGEARSRLYRSQILQGNMRLKALAEIYTMHSFAQL